MVFLSGVRADTAATNAPAAPDYSWLTPETLPPPGGLVDAALDSMPRSFRQKSDWLERMKKASWVPNLELRYGIGERNFRTYQTVSSQTEVSTTTASSRESSSQSGSGAQLSATPSVDVSSGGGSKSQTTTGKTVTQSGPTSYGVDDQSHWVNDYGVFLTWDLSRILFREEEIAVAAAEKEREMFRDSVRQQAIQTYYDLKETLLLLQIDTHKESIPVKIKKERLSYLLDTMTDGALTGGRPKK